MGMFDDVLGPQGQGGMFDDVLGDDKDKGGFVSAAKQVAGRTIKGVGQAASDFLPGVSNENPLTKYGQEVIDANPTAIQGFGDIADNPLMAIREATGNAAGSILPMLGVRAAGQAITAASPLAGPAAPLVAGAGQLVSWLGPTAIAAFPSYSGIRDEQIEANPEHEQDATSKAIAAGGAAAVGMIERFGPSEWALKAMKKEGREALIKQFADAKSLPGAIGKGIIRGGLVEGAEEIAQNPIEQLAAYQDPTTPEALQQTLFSGAMGAIGGGVMGGGMQGAGHIYAKSKQAEREIPPVADTTENQQQPIAGLLPAPVQTGVSSADSLAAAVERQNAVDEAQANADRIYAEQEAMDALYPHGRPVLVTDPGPLQKRIDDILGIDTKTLTGIQRTHYEKALQAAFNEPVGITHDSAGREIPLTMGAYLDARVQAADIGRQAVSVAPASQAGATAKQTAENRLTQLMDEETQPAIPVVGPLSAMANTAVQSGVTQQMQLQQAAKQAEAQAAKAPAGEKKKFPFRKPAEQAAEQSPQVATQVEQAAPVVAPPAVANNPVTPLPEQGAPAPVIQQQAQPVVPAAPETALSAVAEAPAQVAVEPKQAEQSSLVGESTVAQNEPVNTNSIANTGEISTPEDEATYRPLVEALIKRKSAANQVGVSIELVLQQAEGAMRGKKQMPGPFRTLSAKLDKLGDKKTALILRQIADLITASNIASDKTKSAPAKTATNGSLSIGLTPSATEPITVKGGVVHIGDYPAQNFDTGEDVTVPDGATNKQIADALRAAGAVTNKQRIYGIGEDAADAHAKQDEPVISAATLAGQEASEAPAIFTPVAEDNPTDQQASDEDEEIYDENHPVERARAVYAMLHEQGPSEKNKNPEQWKEQIAEQLVNPNRYHKVVEDENPKGLRIGDKAGNGYVASVQKAKGTGRPSGFEVLIRSTDNFGGWSDLGAVEKASPPEGSKESDAPLKSSAAPAKLATKFKEDIPSESWLAEKVEYAKDRGRNSFGVPSMGSVTGSFDGAVRVPVSVLKKLKGERGEQGNRRQEAIDELKKIMAGGRLPPVSAERNTEYAPYIEVAHDGSAWISEGNHRIMAAIELGWESVPVEIRYFDGGQRFAGELSPEKLLPGGSKESIDAAANEAATSPNNDTPQHIEADQSEPATKAVVTESLETGAENSSLNISEQRAWLLKRIDEAIVRAPTAEEKLVWDAAEKRIDLSKVSALRVENEIGYRFFDVPGDGKFKILNLKESLQRFRANVETNAGFKKPVKQREQTTPEWMRVGRSGTEGTIRDLLDDGDVTAAYEYAKQIGKPMVFGDGKDGPIAYTDARPFELEGFDDFPMVSARTFTGNSDTWAIIHPDSGLAVTSGHKTRAKAEAETRKKVEGLRPDSRDLMKQKMGATKGAQESLADRWLSTAGEVEKKAQEKAEAENRKGKLSHQNMSNWKRVEAAETQAPQKPATTNPVATEKPATSKQAAEPKAEDADVAAFTSGMNALARGKATKALATEMRFDGHIESRSKKIRALVEEGRTIETKEGQRALVGKDGSYLLESQITKTGMDFAEFLIGKKAIEGRFIEAPNGSLVFGEITEEIGKSIRRQAGSIRLREGNGAWGRVHIEERHGQDILNLGYSGVPEFVADIAGNFDAIYSGDGRVLVLAKLDKPHGKMNVVLELEKNTNGNIEYYDVKNATPIRSDQFKNREPIWTKEKPLVKTVGPNGSSADADPLIPRGSSGNPSVVTTTKESKSSEASDGTADAGEELTYNKRNRRVGGLKWDDIKDKNAALRVKEVVKAKVYPKPDYQAMVDGGMKNVVAHIVKQVYDAIAPAPKLGRGEELSDASLQAYIEGVNRVMGEVMRWANDKGAIASWAGRMVRTAGTSFSVMDTFSKNDTPKDFVYPNGWKALGREVYYLGGNKFLGALQPGYDEAHRAIRDINIGWPAKAESWQKQGMKVVHVESLSDELYFNPARKDREAVVVATLKSGKQTIDTLFIEGASSKEDAAVQKAVADRKADIDGKYVLLSKTGRLIGIYPDEAAASEGAREKAKKETGEKISEKGISVQMAQREGVEHRLPGDDVTSERLKETFGFRGVNFGNWMQGDTKAKVAERQLHLNHLYDAFMDLAQLLNLPPKAMSLNGMLGIAVGAQGSGKALAHFVPGVNEINVTRTKGAGALAHEWGHALDHYFATMSGLDRKSEPYLSSHVGTLDGRVVDGKYVRTPVALADVRPEVAAQFQSIVDAMTQRKETKEEHESRLKSGKSNAETLVANEIKKIVSAMDVAKEGWATKEVIATIHRLSERIAALDFGDGRVAMQGAGEVSAVVAELAEAYQKAAGAPLANTAALSFHADRYKALSELLEASEKWEPRTVSTDYQKASAAADGKKRKYWSTKPEMFARAFDAYVVDSLAEKDGANTYLSGVEAVAPQGDERKAIGKAFDFLFAELKTKETERGVAVYNVADRKDRVSPSDKAIYGMAAEGKSATEILKFIASASRNPFYRQLAKLLLKTGIAPSITVGDAKGWKFNAGNDKKYAAAYNQKTDTVALFRPSAAERNMLHELVHAATIKALAKGGMAAGQMGALYRHVKATGKLHGMYGMSDLDEFVSEAFTNPKFQEALKQVSAPKTSGTLSSAWHWFVRVVRGILGIPQGQENALSAALEIGLSVMREDMRLSANQKSANVRGMADQDTVAGTQAPTSAGDGSMGGVKIPAPEIPRKLSQKQFEGILQDIDGYGPIEADDPYRIQEFKSVVKRLKAAGVDYIDMYHVTDASLQDFDLDGIRGSSVDYIGRAGGNTRLSSVYGFLDPDDIEKSYDGVLGAESDTPNVIHIKVPVERIGDFRWDSNFNLTYGAYSGVRFVGDIPAKWISGAYRYNIQNEPSASAGSDADGIRYNVIDDTWNVSEPSKMDDVIYALQDKHIDTRRVIQSIRATGKQIADETDPYLQEELFHGRAAKRVKDFLDFELRPLLAEMQAKAVDMGDFEEYLWNRHAEERNRQIAKVNPEMQDGGSGIKTADARAYLSGLSSDQRIAYEGLAKKIDAINRKSQDALVDSGLEKRETIDAWNNVYKHYVPLQREDVDSGHIGTGKGFSVRGSATKRAMGSGRNVVDIIANIAMQRERNIVRAEKNRVSESLRDLAMQNPNPDFWKVDEAPKERVVQETAIYTVLNEAGDKVKEFTRMDEAEKFAKTIENSTVDQTWGDRVTERVVPGFTQRDNVILTRINGEDRYIVFNERNERAMRLALAMKNLDADNLGRVLSIVGMATRYLASVNTQYNPVFGVINLIRDTQGAMLNLSSTPLAGEQKRILGYTMGALRGIYADIRAHRKGKAPSSEWAQMFEEYQREGGQTGYRDQYANAEQRAESIVSELNQTKEGKAKHMLRGMFGWLSDYNETMENAVRLATYRAAKEKGLSKQQAASLAKNITVNFNRKGQMATQIGALYAFFNASVQGTARIAQTLFEQSDGDIKKVKLSALGKKIVYGGILLGAMQAMLLAAAGFDDDEPPEFIRERNLILPIGGGKYLTLAMPLGFHVLPGLGRIATEFFLSGGKDPSKRLASLLSMFAEAFNPVGNAGFSLQTITPSVVDPFAALAENKDFTGKEIYRENFNNLNPQPGHARAKDVATFYSRFISEAINYMTGGTQFKPGVLSPSPDAIDYLIGQATGGVGREANKAWQTAGSQYTGEDLPLYKVPLVGRFIGDTEGQSGQSQKFYDAIKQINMHESEYKGLMKAGKPEEARAYLQENPAVRLIMAGNHAENQVRKLRSMKRDLVENEAPREKIREVDARITETMRKFSERAEAVAF